MSEPTALRTLTNKAGVTEDLTKTSIFFASDWTGIKNWFTYMQELISAKLTNLGLAQYSNLNLPEGFLINGKLVPSISGSGIVITLVGLNGSDPSATNPVYVRVGGVVRTIANTSNFSIPPTYNYFNAGASEVNGKECDYFVYIGYNATDGLTFGMSRIFGRKYGDFSHTYNSSNWLYPTNEAHADANDSYVCVGRFGATLTVTSTWAVPTFTPENLIQAPVSESRLLDFVPTITGYSANPTNVVYQYKIVGRECRVYLRETTVGTSNATTKNYTIPISCITLTNGAWYGVSFCTDPTLGQVVGIASISSSSATLAIFLSAGTWANGSARVNGVSIIYPI